MNNHYKLRCTQIAALILGHIMTAVAVIGDIMTDKTDADVIGCMNTLARTGGHTRTYNDRTANIMDLAHLILTEPTVGQPYRGGGRTGKIRGTVGKFSASQSGNLVRKLQSGFSAKFPRAIVRYIRLSVSQDFGRLIWMALQE